MDIDRENYMLFNLSYVEENIDHFKKYAHLAHTRFKFNFGNKSSTELYRYYNCIGLLSGSKEYYKMFKDIFKKIREFSQTEEPLWFQCWLNLHKKNELLKWHNHVDSLFHGYISIDPKNTETVFENHTIKNKTGNVYIGHSYKYHKVICKNNYEDERITIAFDVVNEDTLKETYKKYGEVDINTSYMPIY